MREKNLLSNEKSEKFFLKIWLSQGYNGHPKTNFLKKVRLNMFFSFAKQRGIKRLSVLYQGRAG